MSDKLWICNEISEDKVNKIAVEAGVSKLVAKVFLSRGIEDVAYIKKFLNPSFEDMHNPFLLNDMDKAVDRLARAIRNKEKVLIYGDYDVDGVTSTSVLFDFLRNQGVEADFYIPDRISEGYGLSISTVEKILNRQPSLIVTVDCGVTAFEEIKLINSNSIDVIITDHHECMEDLPGALAVINPCRHDSTYPFSGLAGIGVVYKLINALCMKLGLGYDYKKYLDMVALGTVADVVPLIDENRVLVRSGLKELENTSNIGLNALIENSGAKEKTINSWTIGYVLAPRINVAGRIGDAGRAVRLFTTNDREVAKEIVAILNDENKFRQDTELQIIQQVIETIESDLQFKNEKVIVASGQGWHHGIIGIVASKVVERYSKPCILLSVEDGICRGSARSVEGFDLFKALENCSRHLEKYGGHELAAGLTLKFENLPDFRRDINIYADSVLEEWFLIPKTKMDVPIDKTDASLEQVRELDKLAPFGAENPVPVFIYSGVYLDDIRTVGDKKHLKLRVEDEGTFFEAIGFNMGGRADTLSKENPIDLACSLEINTWNSIEKVQLNLKDIRLNEEVIMEYKFYHSFDNSIKFKDSINDKPVKMPERCDNFDDLIREVLESNEKTAILVNSLESLRNIEKMLRKLTLGIKKPLKICYTNFDSGDIDIKCVIVNPNPELVDFSIFNRIIFYGNWINRAYLNGLIKRVENKNTLICDDCNNGQINIEDITVDRRDLTAVYQYVKTNGRGYMAVYNFHALAKRISNESRININYFKLNKCIGIFEELGLIKREPGNGNSVLLRIQDRGGEKANLEESALYRSMQELKKLLVGA